MVRDQKIESLEKACLYPGVSFTLACCIKSMYKSVRKNMGVKTSKSMSGKSKEKKGKMDFVTRSFL